VQVSAQDPCARYQGRLERAAAAEAGPLFGGQQLLLHLRWLDCTLGKVPLVYEPFSVDVRSNPFITPRRTVSVKGLSGRPSIWPAASE
jgi:hypothetical protein